MALPDKSSVFVVFRNGPVLSAIDYDRVLLRMNISDPIIIRVTLTGQQPGIIPRVQNGRRVNRAISVDTRQILPAPGVIETVHPGHPVRIERNSHIAIRFAPKPDVIISRGKILEVDAIGIFRDDDRTVGSQQRDLDLLAAFVPDADDSGGFVFIRDDDTAESISDQGNAVVLFTHAGEAAEIHGGDSSAFHEAFDVDDMERSRSEELVGILNQIGRAQIVQQSAPERVGLVTGDDVRFDERIHFFRSSPGDCTLKERGDRVAICDAGSPFDRNAPDCEHDFLQHCFYIGKSLFESFRRIVKAAIRHGLLNHVAQVGLLDEASGIAESVLIRLEHRIREDGLVRVIVCLGDRIGEGFQRIAEPGIPDVDGGEHSQHSGRYHVPNHDLRHFLRRHARGDRVEECMVVIRRFSHGNGFRGDNDFRASSHLRRYDFGSKKTIIEDHNRDIAFFVQKIGNFRDLEACVPVRISREVPAELAILFAMIPQDQAIVVGRRLFLNPIHKPFQRLTGCGVEFPPGFPVDRHGQVGTVGDLADSRLGPEGIPFVCAVDRYDFVRIAGINRTSVRQDVDVDLRIHFGLLHADDVIEGAGAYVAVCGHIHHIRPLRLGGRAAVRDGDRENAVFVCQQVVGLVNGECFPDRERAQLVAGRVLYRNRAVETRRAFRERVNTLRLFSRDRKRIGRRPLDDRQIVHQRCPVGFHLRQVEVEIVPARDDIDGHDRNPLDD